MGVSVAAIVLAGGSGSRVQADVNKVYLPIRDRDVLQYSLETMDLSPHVSRVVLVARESDLAGAADLLSATVTSVPAQVVPGGVTRHLSEMAGLRAIQPEIEHGIVEVVAIHDGARPFVTLELLEQVVMAAAECGGAVPGLPIDEPLYRPGEGGVQMLSPASLRRVQTPQAFRAQELLRAYEASIEAGSEGVDTAETVERFGDLTVRVIPGDPRNMKVTFVEDFFTAEEYALRWDKGRWVDRGTEPT